MLNSDLHRWNRFINMVWFKCTTFCLLPHEVFTINVIGKRTQTLKFIPFLPSKHKGREDTDEQLNMGFIL